MFAEPGTLPEANRTGSTSWYESHYPRWQSSFAKSPCPRYWTRTPSSRALCFHSHDETEHTWEPTEEHLKYIIHGFDVYVSGRIMQDKPEETELALWTMRGQISHLRNVLPASAYRKLITTKIWINDDTDGMEEDEDVVCKWLATQAPLVSMKTRTGTTRSSIATLTC